MSIQNILNAAIKTMKNLVEENTTPPPPLHIGEAMGVWTYLAALEEIDSMEGIALNTTQDQELRDILLEAQKICQSEIRALYDFMKQEGIPLPKTEEPKPISNPSAIPYGVKLSDEEIANGLAVKAAGAIIHCAANLAQSLRTDVGIMWIRFQAEQITYATSLKDLMRKRNWLKVPPDYLPPGGRA